MNIKSLEKKRLKLYKAMLEHEQKMETCSWKDYLTIQFEYGVICRNLLRVEKEIKILYPNITNEFDYVKKINYGKQVK